LEEVAELQELEFSMQLNTAKFAGWAVKFGEKNRNGYIFTKDSFSDFSNFMKNPVMLFNHDENHPIGHITKLEIRDEGLWVEGEVTEEEIAKQLKAGTLKAMSVHGIGLVDEKGIVRDFELFEISIVSIPADPNAIVEIVQKVPPLKIEAVNLTDPWDWDWSEDANKIIDNLGWKGLANACAYYETEPDGSLKHNKRFYKLPHKKYENGKLVTYLSGVQAALRRLPQADIPEKERKRVEDYLHKLLDALKELEDKINNEKEADTTMEKVEMLEQKLERIEAKLSEMAQQPKEIEITPEMEMDMFRVHIAQKAGIQVEPEYIEIKQFNNLYDVMPALPTAIDKKIVDIVIDYSKLINAIGIQKVNSLKVAVPVHNSTFDGTTPLTRWSEGSAIGQMYQTTMFMEYEITALAGLYKLSELALKNAPNFIDMMNIITNDFSVAVAKTLEKEVIDQLGSLETTSLAHEPTLDDLADAAFTATASYSGRYAWVMKPSEAYKFFIQKDSNGNYIFGTPAADLNYNIWGYPVYTSEYVPDNTIYLVNLDRVRIYKANQSQSEVGRTSDDFANGMVSLRLITFIDVLTFIYEEGSSMPTALPGSGIAITWSTT